MIVQHPHHVCQLMKHNCTLCQGASVLTQQVLLNRITSHQKAKIIHMLKFIQVAQQKPACILLHLMIMNFKFVQPKEHVTREMQQCQPYLCRLTQLLMNRLKAQLPFHRQYWIRLQLSLNYLTILNSPFFLTCQTDRLNKIWHSFYWSKWRNISTTKFICQP